MCQLDSMGPWEGPHPIASSMFHRVHGSPPLCVESTRAATTRPGWRAGPIGGMGQVQEAMATSQEQTTPPTPPPVLEGILEGAHRWLGGGEGLDVSGRSQVSAGLSRAGNLSGCFEEKCKLDEVSQHPVDTKDETVAPHFMALLAFLPQNGLLSANHG